MFSIELRSVLSEEGLRSLGEVAAFPTPASDLLSLIGSICDQLENLGAVELHVGGFGQDRWPVDVRTDLAVVMEQMPPICETLSRGEYRFNIDFYEQGIERYLAFVPADSRSVRITCTSTTQWKPNPASELVAKTDLRGMLERVGSRFRAASEMVCPKLSRHPALTAYWQKLASVAVKD
jgi:hypothetical protein